MTRGSRGQADFGRPGILVRNGHFPFQEQIKPSPVKANDQPARLIGEHNEYAFKEILGISDEEIARLMIEEVIE